MVNQIIDNKVYNAIKLIIFSQQKPTVRKIAKIINKEKSLLIVQSSLKRLIAWWYIYRNEKNILEVDDSLEFNPWEYEA